MGFSQAEWLEDPVRWYHHIHPDDQRALERRGRRDVPDRQAAPVGLPGARPRRPRRLVPVRGQDGAAATTAGPGSSTASASTSPTSSRRRRRCRSERNLLSGDARHRGRAGGGAEPGRRDRPVQPRRASCSAATRFDEVRGRYFWDLFPAPEEARAVPGAARRSCGPGQQRDGYEGDWIARDGSRRRIAWSSTVLPGRGRGAEPHHHHRHRHHRAEADGEGAARDQRAGAAPDRPGPARRPGPAPDRHRVHEQGAGAAAGRRQRATQAEQARKIVRLVNEAINKTRELARGLLPVFSDAEGLMSALSSGPARSRTCSTSPAG